MREASGELNMTVVTVVAIGALVAFFYLLIWPTIQTSMALTSACNASGGESYSTGNDEDGKIECGQGKCTYTKDNKTSTKQCSKQNMKEATGELNTTVVVIIAYN